MARCESARVIASPLRFAGVVPLHMWKYSLRSPPLAVPFWSLRKRGGPPGTSRTTRVNDTLWRLGGWLVVPRDQQQAIKIIGRMLEQLESISQQREQTGRDDIAEERFNRWFDRTSRDLGDVVGENEVEKLTEEVQQVHIDNYESLHYFLNVAISMCESYLVGVRDELELSPETFLHEPEEEHRANRKALRDELESQRNTMISVATGGPRIQAVESEYRRRRKRIHDLLVEIGLEDSNPFPSLWDWYGKWSSGDLPTYQSRREFIGTVFAPVLERLDALDTGTAAREHEPTGWAEVDRRLQDVRLDLERATEAEHFQKVALGCREVLVALAQTVHNQDDQPAPTGDDLKNGDAKGRLDAYLSAKLSGSTNEVTRKVCRSTLQLASALVHNQASTFRPAALCHEATATLVNFIAIIEGRRDPT